jgi:hypothetical protein
MQELSRSSKKRFSLFLNVGPPFGFFFSMLGRTIIDQRQRKKTTDRESLVIETFLSDSEERSVIIFPLS